MGGGWRGILMAGVDVPRYVHVDVEKLGNPSGWSVPARYTSETRSCPISSVSIEIDVSTSEPAHGSRTSLLHYGDGNISQETSDIPHKAKIL